MLEELLTFSLCTKYPLYTLSLTFDHHPLPPSPSCRSTNTNSVDISTRNTFYIMQYPFPARQNL